MFAIAAALQPAAGAGLDQQQKDASRIVSVGGAITEILYALGLDTRIVGVDSTSLYPPQALADKPNVGYMRQLSAEGVLGLAPTLILAVEGAGPKETIAVLESSKVPIVTVPDRYTAEGIVAKIDMVAAAVGAERRGACLAAAVRADLAALEASRPAAGPPPRVLFVLSFLNGRAMVGGRNSAADTIIAMAGGVNAIGGFDGYKLVNDEALIAARPDVVLTMQRGRESLTADAVFAHPALAMTPAARTKRFIAMDGLYLLGFGPRTARAARDLAQALHPAAGRADLPSDRAGTCAP